jgi:hypothetical protein
MDTAVAELLKYGLVGAVAVAACVLCAFMYRENKLEREARAADNARHAAVRDALQDKRERDQQEQNAEFARIHAQRVQDAQGVTERLLRVNEEVVAALANSTSALEATQASLGELKQAFRDLEAEMRARPRRAGG